VSRTSKKSRLIYQMYYIHLLSILCIITTALTAETFKEGYMCHAHQKKSADVLNVLDTTTKYTIYK